MKRRIIIHSDSPLKAVHSNIESDLVRYLSGEIIGIIDKSNAGKTAESVLGFGGDIPIAATLDEFLTLKPNYLLIGASSFKGTFPMEWYPMVIKALQMRIHILNGLHQPLNSLAEFDLLAKKYKAKIIDLRENGEKPIKFKNVTRNIQAKKVLIAGANSNSGELTTTMEIVNSIHKDGISADWIATGLSSRLIKGKGFIAESLTADLISGYVENELMELDQKFEYLFVESQGAINDPIKASVCIGILHGVKPDAVILSYLVDSSNDVDSVIKSYENYKNVLRQITKADLIGVALNTALLSEENANEMIKGVKAKIHLPVIDPIRSGVSELVNALKGVEKVAQN
jgi:D-glutamate N-acetyltransferase